MTFWLVFALLVLVAATLVVAPLLRRPVDLPPDAGRRRAEMRALYRDRLAELDREQAAGQLDPQAREQVLAELDANLYDEFQATDASPGSAPGAPSAPPRLALWLTLVLLPAAAVAIYLSSGEPGAGDIAGAAEVLRLDPNADRARLEVWRDRLSARTARRPEDAQSWYLLGVSGLQLGRFADAERAFARAHGLIGADSTVDLYWLQARYLVAGGTLDADSREIARRLLDAQPSQPLVLEMFAIDAYRKGDFRGAVEHLNRALNNPLPPAQQAALVSGLDQARSRMGVLRPSVDVAVSAPADAPREGTVFVIARPPGGGMPYAVVRRPAGMLPLSVTLDDTTSMRPELLLSAAGPFEVVVRLSRTGAPAAGPGDLEWRSEVLDPAKLTGPVTLEASLAAPDATAGG